MAVRSKEEIMNAIRARIGEDTSDEAISLIEDISDTVDDLTGRIGEDWKAKYEENDASWRQRYTERFFGGGEPATQTTEYVEGDVAVEEETSENDITLDDILA